ncbi:hypothetical protein IEQ34_003963 [Dendrobium chrysotoxum]|uniref:Amine oxidase domain-containing protein n=1 Tax=Dendrobium chrysotoxum TaxID=161865 RepID=A0AAV7GY03_DENCH|nr:hypothetical protein IEQ34_003963 [Dendrobium chrysotoxum]
MSKKKKKKEKMKGEEEKEWKKRMRRRVSKSSGLAAAYKLKTNGLKVTLFDVQDRAGGKIKSASEDGFIWDEGANTMTESESAVGRLLDDLGLREKQQFPISQNKRYVVRNGMPQLIPSNPVALIKSNILSTQSKLKILLEPLSWWHSDKRSSIKVCDTGIQESPLLCALVDLLRKNSFDPSFVLYGFVEGFTGFGFS